MNSVDSPSIARLPLEVLEVCVQLSPVESQLSISRVSRLFHSLTIRPLYCDISLSSKRAVISCCRTLIANGVAAKTVRSFLINYTYYSSSSNSLLAGYYSLIIKALQALSGLHTIKLLVHDPYFVTLLHRSMSPALRQFECYLTPSPGLIEFLNRHPRINYLQVSPNEDTSGLSTVESLPALSLPRLQYFAGNVQSVPFLCTTSRLRAAIISWNAMDTHPDLALTALQRSSADSLAVLSCRRRGWNLDLIEAISSHLPDVVSLQISNILLVDSRPTETYLQTIRCFLPRFTQLQRLKINCIDYWEMGDISCQIDQDFSTVSDWGEACSSLIEITLPHSDELTWYRMSRNLWIPDPKHTAGSAWLYDSVVLKRHAQWNVLVEALQESLSEPIPAIADELVESIAVMRSRLGGLLQTTIEDASVHLAGASNFRKGEAIST